jgi:hypothetical protein
MKLAYKWYDCVQLEEADRPLNWPMVNRLLGLSIKAIAQSHN